MNLRVMTYNIHSCIGTDRVLSPERIAEVIAIYNPDVVALQELDVARSRTGHVDQARVIAGLLAYTFHFHPAMEVKEERFGDAILSRYPLALRHAARLPTGSRGRRRKQRGALWVTVHLDKHLIQVINTHMGLNRQERRAQADRLLGTEWLRHADCQAPVVVCGDFNSLPRTLVHRRFKSVLHDTQPLWPGRRSHNTYPSRYPMWRIDYIFVSSDVRVRDVIVPRTKLTRLASDHLPVIADLTIS